MNNNMQKLFCYVNNLAIFNTLKISADSTNTKYTINSGNIQEGTPDITWERIAFIDEEHLLWTHGTFYDGNNTDLTEELKKYITITEADNKYILKKINSSSTSAISISSTGSFNNYGNNGQAFNAVRDLTGTTKYLGPTGSGFVLDAASFGVKDTGTTAFSHKKYDTFNKDTGAYTGAKNTAVLVFSGKSGLLYAKNTGEASDVTDAMYKYVGVIDSPDTAQKVYSASQSDGITNALANRISDLETQNEYLMNVITLLIEKTGITEDELSALSSGTAKQSLSNLDDDVQNAIEENTTDYSQFSNEESTEIV